MAKNEAQTDKRWQDKAIKLEASWLKKIVNQGLHSHKNSNFSLERWS